MCYNEEPFEHRIAHRILSLTGFTMCKRLILIGIYLSILLLFVGCKDDEEVVVAPGSTPEADAALRKAEAKLAAAGLSLSFEEPGDLTHPEDLIPDPAELADEEKQKDFEEIIDRLNVVIAELEKEGPNSPVGSISDRALLHLYLGFLYLYEAISRLLISDDPGETFIIESNPGSANFPWYDIGVSSATQKELDAVRNPLEYPLVFTAKERQAIIDATDLIDDAIVKPVDPNIQPRLSSVDRPPYSRYAIWHFEKAASLFAQYKPDIAEALEDFIQQVDNMRAELQARSEGWGFTYALPPWR